MDKRLNAFLLDQLKAINTLNESGLFLQAAMLIYASIDQMAWLSIEEEKNIGKDFKKWVDFYFDTDLLDDLGVTADELWEARNALLHTATAESQKNTKNEKIRKIYYLAGYKCTENKNPDSKVFVDVHLFTQCFCLSCMKFISDVGNRPNDFKWLKGKLDKLFLVRKP